MVASEPLLRMLSSWVCTRLKCEEPMKGNCRPKQYSAETSSLVANYENRLRTSGKPYKIFEYFSSTLDAHQELAMTHHDFLRAICCHTFQKYAHEFACPSELFDLIDLNQDGLLSFTEYLVFRALLHVSDDDLRIIWELVGRGVLEGQIRPAAEATVCRDQVLDILVLLIQKEFKDLYNGGHYPQGVYVSDLRASIQTSKIIQKLFPLESENSSYETFLTLLISLRKQVFYHNFARHALTWSLDPTGEAWLTGKEFCHLLSAFVNPNGIQNVCSRIDQSQNGVFQRTFKFADFLIFQEFLLSLERIRWSLHLIGRSHQITPSVLHKILSVFFENFGGPLAQTALNDGACLEQLVDLIFYLLDANENGVLDESEIFDCLMGSDKMFTRLRSVFRGFL